MPTASTTLSILVKLQDEASAAMQGLGANLQSIGASMTSVGKTMTTDITLPLVGFATYAAKGAMDFQQAMTQIQTQAGASAEEVQNLSDQVMKLAESAQQGPTDLANGLFHLVSLGLDANDAMRALKVASDGAAVGQANLEDVTNALGGAISSGIKGTSDYAGTMATLNAIVGSGNMRMTDLVNALGTGILASARVAGLSIQDVGAALATMTDNGIPAEDAATRLRMTFQLMAAPSAQAEKALQSLGMTQFELADDMRSKGLLGALQDLQDHLSKVSADAQTADLTKMFGGARSGSAVELLLTNMDKLGSKYATIDNGVKNFQSDVQAQADTWNGEMDNMNANLQVFRDGVGKSLLQVANQVFPIITNLLQDLLNAWEHLSPGMQKAIIIFGAVAAAIGPVLVVVGTLITAIGSIITFISGFIGVMGTIVTAVAPVIAAIGAVVAAIGLWPIVIGAVLVAVVALIVTHWTQVKNFLTTAGTDILGVLTKAWNAIKGVIEAVWTGIVDLTKLEIDLIVGIIVLALDLFDPQWRQHWQAISAFFTDLWNTIKSFLTATWNWITSLFNTSLSGIETLWNTVWGGISSFFIGIWDGVKNALSSALGFVRSEINSFVSWAEGVFQPVLNAVNAIGSVASSFGKAVGSGVSAVASIGSQITHFATGGIVNGPTIALVGEAGPEAIIPLSAFNNGMSLARGGSSGGASIVVNINGGNYLDSQGAIMIANELARQVNRQVRVANYSR